MYGLCRWSFVRCHRTLCWSCPIYGILSCNYWKCFIFILSLFFFIMCLSLYVIDRILSIYFPVDLCRKSIFLTRIFVTPCWWGPSAARACCFRKRRVNHCPTWSGADTGWSAWRKWRDCRARGMHLDDVIRNIVGKVI